MKWKTTCYETELDLKEAAKHSIFASDVRYIRSHKMQRTYQSSYDFGVSVKAHREWDDVKEEYGPVKWFGVAKDRDSLFYAEDGWASQLLSGDDEFLGREGFPTAQACKEALKRGDRS